MPKLLVKRHAPDMTGCTLSVTPESAGWKHVGFAAYRRKAGETANWHFKDRESCLVILSGTATVKAPSQVFEKIGTRKSVFEGNAASVYAPADMHMELKAETDIEFAICSAPGTQKFPVRLIAPGDVGEEKRGQGTNTRYVRNILPDTAPAESLLVVEVVTPGGHWSSYPPHKHDRDALPEESFLEETYYHRLNPPQGFAFQRVYTDDRSLDETMAVEDGDCVMVPRGYHPVGAAHGYDLYYLNVMAGPTRRWVFKNDPQHEWMVKR
jgi:5-deoxy-glucuronate isomerase